MSEGIFLFYLFCFDIKKQILEIQSWCANNTISESLQVWTKNKNEPRFYDHEVRLDNLNMDNIHETAPVWVSTLVPACVLRIDTTHCFL